MRKAAVREDRGPPRVYGEPKVGFFKVRVVARGPWVPARIFRLCHCTVNGGDGGQGHDWAGTCDRYPPLRAVVGKLLVDPCEGVWHANSREITEPDYYAMVFERALEDENAV